MQRPLVRHADREPQHCVNNAFGSQGSSVLGRPLGK